MPIDIISTSDDNSNTIASIPARAPAKNVEKSGVSVRLLTHPKDGNMRPSVAIAYRSLGNGNNAPVKLAVRPQRAPTEIMYLATKRHFARTHVVKRHQDLAGCKAPSM